MGAWGAGSDENDHAADAVAEIHDVCDLYADDEGTPRKGQALADAQDAALLSGDATWYASSVTGAIVSLLRDGYRVPRDPLEYAEKALRAEDVGAAANGWADGGAERTKAIAAELELIAAAKANANQLPVAQRDPHASKGLIDTILSKEDPDAYEEAVQAERAKLERSVIPAAPPPPPFGWLDAAAPKGVAQVAKHLGVRCTGMEKHEVVGAIKAHPKRWHARRFAPYHAA